VNVADYPALYQSADSASLAGQTSYARLVKLDLTLVVAAGVLAAAGALLPLDLETYFAVATALVLLGGLVVKVVSNARRGDQDWFDGRAVASTVMSEAWSYMMRLEPFHDETTCDEVFLESIRSLLLARPNLHHAVGRVSAAGEQITGRMRDVRAMPVDERAKVYLQGRLDDQAGWYWGRAQANQRAASIYFWAATGAQAVAFVIAVFHPILGHGSLNLVGPFAVLATALAAWSAFRNHDDLSKSYALAYQELLGVRSLGRNVTTQEQLNHLVRDAEGAISREHTTWTAKRTDLLPHQFRAS
jgi:hypothetical protein